MEYDNITKMFPCCWDSTEYIQIELVISILLLFKVDPLITYVFQLNLKLSRETRSNEIRIEYILNQESLMLDCLIN